MAGAGGDPPQYVDDSSLTDSWNLTSEKARKAKQEYEAARKKSRTGHDYGLRQAKSRYEAQLKYLAEIEQKEAAHARKVLKAALQDALQEAADAGDIDEAQKIRSAISALDAIAQKEAQSAKPAPQPAAVKAHASVKAQAQKHLSGPAKLIAEAMRGLPLDLRPDPEAGWDEWTRPKVEEWLKRRKGLMFEGEGTFVEARSNYRSANRWSLHILWKGKAESVDLEGCKMVVKLTTKSKSSYSYNYPRGYDRDISTTSGATVTESVARNWADVKKGTRLTVKGKVSELSIGSDGKLILVHLANVSVDVFKEPPKVVAKPPGEPKGAPTTAPAPADPAATKLALAKAYLGAGKKFHAAALLREIVHEYPESEEAKEAALLLKEFGSD